MRSATKQAASLLYRFGHASTQPQSVILQTAFRLPAVASTQHGLVDALWASNGYTNSNRCFSAQPAPIPNMEPTDSETKETSPGETPTEIFPHPGLQADIAEKSGGTEKGKGGYWLMQPVYTPEYVRSVKPKHRKPTKFHDYTGYYGVQALRGSFDLMTGYGPGKMNASKWLTRMCFLETVAGVPGMVAAMLRHMRSLRTMKRDNGWIHTLLEEAENERMHLLTFLTLKQPSTIFRASVLVTQGVFLSLYSVFYAISPRHCHAFVSYLEEEAVKTYTHAIEDIETGQVKEWQTMAAPDLAIRYWRLKPDATMKDVLLAVRADEACHNHVNAKLAELKADDPNPFAPGTTMVQ